MSDNKGKKKVNSVWNLPNALTMMRVFLIIPFAVLLLGGQKGWFGPNLLIPDILADIVFIVASVTDLLDGRIARAMGLVTNFGKFMDPLADKLLVCTALVALVDMGRIPAWIVIIIIAREFIISGFRLVAAQAGIVISASYWGKFKTTFQMIMVIMLIVQPSLHAFLRVPLIAFDIVMYAALILTVISLLDYMIKNRSVLR